MALKSLTIRLPDDLYRKSAEAAKQRNVSFNALVRESLAETVAKEEYRLLYEAFTEIGLDASEADVEYAEAAQWEVIRDEQT